MTTTDIQVEVTQERIDNGIPCHCGLCAIAISIEAAAPGLGPVVNAYHVWVGPPKGRVAIPLPTVAKQFRHDFDEGYGAKPCSFPLPIPSHLIATGQGVGL